MTQKKKFNIREILSLGLATAGLLLAEVVVNNYSTYLLNEVYLNIVPVLVFAGISFGNILYHWKSVRSLNDSSWAFITALMTILSYLGFCWFPEQSLLWIVIPFIGYGGYLCSCYGSMRLSSLVLGFGFGGLALYFMMGFAFQWIAPALALISILFPFLSVIPAGRLKLISGSILMAILSVFIHIKDGFEPKLLAELRIEGFRDARRISEPLYTPLIRTDLFEDAKGRRIIVTNGRRFAVVRPADRVQQQLASKDSFIPSYDIPYKVFSPQRVLVIGSAEGNNIISALKGQADSIVAVDINPAVIELMQGPLREFSGGTYTHPKVKAVVSEGRHYIETTRDTFDLITLQGVQTGSSNHLINTALLESHLLTKESIRAMWGRLSEKGCLWIEEYQWAVGQGEAHTTLVKSVAQTAQRELNLVNIGKHAILAEYRQAKSNPNQSNRQIREGLLLCKNEINVSSEALETFAMKDVRLQSFDFLAEIESELVTDQHPYFVLSSNLIAWLTAASLLALLGTLFASLIQHLKNQQVPVDRNLWSLFLIGAGFMLLISAAIGPLSLLLGDPQLGTPVLFVSMYAFGMIGGMLGLRVSEKFSRSSLLYLAFYILALPFLFELIKPWVMPLEQTWLRVLIFVLLIAPVGLLAELPYIWLLRLYENQARAKAYTIENLGTLMAVPFGIYLQLVWGFYAALCAAAVFYLLALFSLADRPLFRKHKLALLGVLIILTLFALSLLRFDFKESERAKMKIVGQSEDCLSKPVSPHMEVARRNADALKSESHIRVLVGPGDGCYKTDTELPLFAIKRNPDTREIIEREERGQVRIQRIVRATYSELKNSQKEYARQKFGEKARDHVFNIVFLKLVIADSGDLSDEESEIE